MLIIRSEVREESSLHNSSTNDIIVDYNTHDQKVTTVGVELNIESREEKVPQAAEVYDPQTVSHCMYLLIDWKGWTGKYVCDWKSLQHERSEVHTE